MRHAETERPATPDFLSGGGEMGSLCRAFDWSKTSLGPVDSWPQSLRSAVGILLPSQAQIILFAGRELVCIYNDAYRPIFGARHPWALGKPGAEGWDVVWHVLGPLLEGVVRTGEAFSARDFPYFIDRGGFLEEVYFDISYDPVRDESAGVGGVFCIVSETSARVLGERRLSSLRNLGARAATVSESVEAACEAAMETAGGNQRDIPFALIYRLAGQDWTLSAATPGPKGLLRGAGLLPPEAWPLQQVFDSRTPLLIDGLSLPALHVEGLPQGCTPRQALLLPLSASDLGKPQGVLVAGLSAVLAPDETYKGFFDLLARHVATAIANANAYQEEKKRAEALAELDRAKTTFFSNVSHEFRTPLTLMLGPIEETLAQPGLPADARQRLEIAHRNSLRLLKMVNTLLDFSRIEAGRIKASYAPADLSALTQELASNFRSAMESAGLELIVDCAALSQPVYVDREMWEKIVLNLLSNAFKFTFEGNVTVRLRERGGHAELTVSDTGTGIPASELPHIFERFHRVEGAKGRSFEGTGIGLALIQELVKLHGGSVSAESRAGEGSTFTVSLPFGAAHLPPEHIGERHTPSAGVRSESFTGEALNWLSGNGAAALSVGRPETRARILVADDNSDMREYVVRILAPSYDIATATDGQKALDLIRQDPPDLLLTDVMMPALDGFGLLRAVRAEDATRTLPVIFLSARAGEEARVEGIQAGADDYLVKPFTANELRARVGTHVKMAEIRRESLHSSRKSEEQLRLITDTLPVLVSYVDTEYRYRFANRTYTEWFGRARDEVVGRTVADVLGEEAFALLLPHMARALNGEIVSFENTVPYSSGRRQVYANYVPDVSEEGEVRGFVVLVEDITGRKRTEEDLRRANKDLEQFAYSASHDLQEPLRTIKIYSELLESRSTENLDAESLQFLEYLRNGAGRMEMLVHGLLAYTQAMQGSSPDTPVDAGDALAKAIANLERSVSESGARVTWDAMPHLRVHAAQLIQLFQNLIGNAIKYRRPGVAPLVHVAVQRESNYWHFQISDNGIGIEPEYREHIFGIFKRLHTSDQYSGTGIGLALCQRIVEGYRGHIWVESEPGAGSHFHFTLPA